MVADAATAIVLLAIVVVACLAVFTLVFIIVAIGNLAIIGVRELAYRRRRRRRAEALYGRERRS